MVDKSQILRVCKASLLVFKFRISDHFTTFERKFKRYQQPSRQKKKKENLNTHVFGGITQIREF